MDKIVARLIVICHMPPPVHGASIVGGIVAHSELLRARFDCTIIPIQMNNGLDSVRLFSFSKVTASLRLYGRLIWALLTKRPDAVYITVALNGFAAIRDAGIVLLCRMSGVQRILHVHMRGLRPRYESSARYRLLYRLIFGGAQVIHSSQRLYADVAPVVPPEKFHVLAYGAPDPSRLSSATAKIASEAPEATAFVPDILFMSNLYIDKGPLDLLEVSRRLHTQGIAHRVIFVGGKADAAVDEALARAIAEDGSGRIDLRGAIYGAQKDALLHSVQIFAFPSYYHFECQPLSVIEAMSHGLAIVASDIAGIPDLIRDGEDGFLIPARDPDALVSGLRKLLLDRGLRERLGRSARERYETLFTLQAFEQRLVETIEKIVL